MPETLEQLTIEKPEILREWVRAYTKVPVTEASKTDEEELKGKQTQSSRFLLKDGRSVEFSAIWVGPKDVIVVWPDGSVGETTWGSPDLFNFYETSGSVREVGADERPIVSLPN